MTLNGPNEEDVRKIHAEINQIVNQRLLITTIAITIFGVVIQLIIPKKAPTVGSEINPSIFIASILLIFVLLLLFIYSYWLKGVLRIYTTYLLVTGKSDWEHDWERYRKGWYWAYTKTQTVFFWFLGLISCILPFIIAYVYSLNYTLKILLWAFMDITVFGVYSIILLVMGFCKLLDEEPKAKDKWENLNRDQL